MSAVALIESQIRSIETSISVANQQLAQARRDGDNVRVAELNAFLAELQSSLAQAQSNLRAEIAAQGTSSAGQVVAEEARARSEEAPTSNPPPGTTVLTPTGRIASSDVETGTNAPTRTQENTQSTPPAGNGSALPYAAPGDEDAAQAPFATTQAGAGAAREDNTAPNANQTSRIINASFNQRITPRPNILDDYASYTYAISWYLLTPEQYNEMIRSQKKNCASWQLLVQSGGAPTQAAGAAGSATATAGRNQFFGLDYYIDDLEIDSVIPLKGTGAANTATDIKFKITEPNGITLIENLYKAVSNLYKQANVSKQVNYPMAHYCLVVRFYGYNDNGESITTGRSGTNGQTNLTDPRAIVEKFYPFVITNIKFRIPKDRVVEYQVEAKPIPHFYNKSQDRGTIPFSFELVGETVEQVLRGKPVGAINPPSPGERVDSPQPNTSAPTNPSSANDINDAGNFETPTLGVGA
jgi:hypothetical protein